MPSRRKISFKSRPPRNNTLNTAATHSSSPKLIRRKYIFQQKANRVYFHFVKSQRTDEMKRNSTQPKRQLINDNGRNRNDTIEKRGVDLEPRGEETGQRKRKRAKKKKKKIIFRSRHQMRTLLTRHLWLATMDIWRWLLSLANEKWGPRDKWCRLTIACRITQFMIHNASLGRIHISTRAHTLIKTMEFGVIKMGEKLKSQSEL